MASACKRTTGLIFAKGSALLLCDMQEAFRKSITYFPEIVNVSHRMLKGACALKMPVIVSEQYPDGLGRTVPELLDGYEDYVKMFTKTRFSMCFKDVEKHLEELKNLPSAGVSAPITSLILCGIEAHVCVLNTALDFKHKGYDVHCIVDAISSRNGTDRYYAYQRMVHAGIYLTTCESMLLTLCEDARNPAFKQLQKFIMDQSPSSGLPKY